MLIDLVVRSVGTVTRAMKIWCASICIRSANRHTKPLFSTACMSILRLFQKVLALRQWSCSVFYSECIKVGRLASAARMSIWGSKNDGISTDAIEIRCVSALEWLSLKCPLRGIAIDLDTHVRWYQHICERDMIWIILQLPFTRANLLIRCTTHK